jgi:hypothetical protein
MTLEPPCFGDDDRGQAPMDRWWPMGLTVALVLAVMVGANVAGELPAPEFDTDAPADFERYCHAELGDDADVYLANDAAIGAHNGWHCAGDGRTIHRTQIPKSVWSKYQEGDATATHVTEQLRRPPGLIGWLTWPVYKWVFGGVGALAVVAVTYGYITDNTDKTETNS